MSSSRSQGALEPSPLESLVYRYTALPGHRWIRLFNLSPGSGPFEGELVFSNIEDASLKYEGLSYVWGASERPCTVYCSGSPLAIGFNLACALRALRRDSETRILWIDAICINQEDDEERSQQVSVMGDIYAHAKNVLVWMGDDEMDEAAACFQLIEETNGVLAGLLDTYGHIDMIPDMSHSAPSICRDEGKWGLVRRLMERSWFTRVWVLQEVGLARAALLVVGQLTMNWSELVELMLFTAARTDLAQITGRNRSGLIWEIFEEIWRPFGNAHTWRNERQFTKSLNEKDSTERLFVDVLNTTRLFNASDARDHVYGFLAHPSALVQDIAREGERIVEVDYSLSVDEIYLRTAARILETAKHSWTVLACVDHTEASPSLAGQRPSWVPRWDEGYRVHWLGYAGSWYRAGGTQLETFSSTLEICTLSACLSPKGYHFDTVEHVSESFDLEQLTLEMQRKNCTVIDAFGRMHQTGVKSPYGAFAQQEYNFSLVLVSGHSSDGFLEGDAEKDPSQQQLVYRAYQDATLASSSPASNTAIENTPAYVHDYMYNVQRTLHNRRLFMTSKGYYGVAHREVQVGDTITLFAGANVPFVLRQVNDKSNLSHEQQRFVQTRSGLQPLKIFKLVSECYVQGIMRGEVLNPSLREKSDALIVQKIVLV